MLVDERIRNGLEEMSGRFGDYKDQSGILYSIEMPDVSVRDIREKLGMSQRQFAESFCFSLRTIQNWEQNTRLPEGPARAYLVAIKNQAEAVKAALDEERTLYRVSKVERPDQGRATA